MDHVTWIQVETTLAHREKLIVVLERGLEVACLATIEHVCRKPRLGFMNFNYVIVVGVAVNKSVIASGF